MSGGVLNIVGVVALEVSLFAIAMMLFDRFAPKGWVRERHNLAMTGFVLLPVLFVFASQPAKTSVQPVPVSEVVSTMDHAGSAPVFTGPASSPMVSVISDRPLVDPVEPAANLPISLPETLLAIWMAGGLLMLIRLGQDMVLLNGIRTRSVSMSLPEGMRLSRKISVMTSVEVDAPMVAGLVRPVVILPDNFVFDHRAGCVLEHEIAHIRRGDTWAEIFIRVLTSVFWWVLPLHMLHGIVRRTREALCDAHSADVTGTPTELAHALLDAAATRIARVPSLALSSTPSRSTLSARIDHLTTDIAIPRRYFFMRMPFVLPAFAVLAYAATPQLGEAREAPEKDQVIWVHEEGDELEGGDGRHVHVYRGDDLDFDFDFDFDFSELEARLEELDFSELEAQLDNMDFSELEARLDAMGAEIDAKMAEIDFSEFEARMEALGAELEAKFGDIDFSEFEARLDEIDFSSAEARLNAEELARLEAEIGARVAELELGKLAELAELEKMIELEVLSKLDGLKELESLAKLSELSALSALARLPHAPEPPHAPHETHPPHEPHAPEPPEWERN